MQQAERAQQLLLMLETKPDAIEEAHFNDRAYGPAAQQAQRQRQSQLGAHVLGPLSGAHAAGGAGTSTQTAPTRGLPYVFQAPPRLPPPPSLAAPRPNSIPTGPLTKGQTVPSEVLTSLAALDKAQFKTLLTNFYTGLKGKYKIPTFAHAELDVKTVWEAVMGRGGYETATGDKAWKEICGELTALDLSGQTSASYNMRLNYERCLLDFENYCACGEYQKDIAAGKAPVHTHLTDPDTTRFTIPGAYSPLPLNRKSAPKPKPAAQPLQPGQAIVTLKIPAKPKPPQPVEQPDTSEDSSDSSDSSSSSDDEHDAPGPQRFGEMVQALGAAAVGRRLQRFWPNEGGWWDASVSEYNAGTGEHRLMYKVGTPEETFEWADLSEFHDRELRAGPGGEAANGVAKVEEAVGMDVDGGAAAAAPKDEDV